MDLTEPVFCLFNNYRSVNGNHKLGGSLPPQWVGMEALVSLSIEDNNDITGTLPGAWGDWSGLKEL